MLGGGRFRSFYISRSHKNNQLLVNLNGRKLKTEEASFGTALAKKLRVSARSRLSSRGSERCVQVVQLFLGRMPTELGSVPGFIE